MISNDIQYITQKTKYLATRTPLKPRTNSSAPEGIAVPVPHVTPFELLLNDTNNVIELRVYKHDI
jgi:hypothetical protein